MFVGCYNRIYSYAFQQKENHEDDSWTNDKLNNRKISFDHPEFRRLAKYLKIYYMSIN